MSSTKIAVNLQEPHHHPSAGFATRLEPHDDREQEEILRSAAEARQTSLVAARLDRYLDPQPDTPYPLEYAFYLGGDLRDRVVVELGCGSGENLLIAAQRGGRVTGIDISPDLLSLADSRLKLAGATARLREASAYDTGLPSASVDVVFCIAILHHLELPRARAEILRILRPNGMVIVSEPVRDSKIYDRVRRLFRVRTEEDSFFERPLTSAVLSEFAAGFTRTARRRFRLPLIPLLHWAGSERSPRIWRLDRWLLRDLPVLQRYATIEVSRLECPPDPSAVV